MKDLWCWRCKKTVSMLNEGEYAIAYSLYGKGFLGQKSGRNKQELFEPLLDYYYKLTGQEASNPHAIMHHRISLYGPSCLNCGKPYRTPLATFCAACGNTKT